MPRKRMRVWLESNRVSRYWVTACPKCVRREWSRSLDGALRAAMTHRCGAILGPSPLSPDVEVHVDAGGRDIDAYENPNHYSPAVADVWV